MSFALGFARVGELIPQTVPEPKQLIGGHRADWRQRPFLLGQVRRQLGRAQLLQSRGTQRAHPDLLGMRGVAVEVLPVPPTPLGGAQLLPSGGLVTGAPEALRIHKRLERQHRMAKVPLPIRRQPITTELQHPRGQIGPATVAFLR